LPILTGLLSEISLDVTVMTGPIVRQDESSLHFSDYEIDVDQFRSFLGEWLEGSSADAKQADSAACP
jgi:hypothetical protein